MQRREFVTLLGSAAAAWPLTARAQQTERDAAHRCPHEPGRGRSARTRARCGVRSESAGIGLDRRPQRPHRHSVDRRQCCRDAQIRCGTGRTRAGRHSGLWRHGRGDVAPGDQHRADCVHSDVSIQSAAASSRAWRGQAATPPVLPLYEYGMGGKWLELLKEIAPSVTRAAVLRDPAIPQGIGQLAAIQSVAPSLGVEVSPVNMPRRRRGRARRRGLRTPIEWRLDRDGERGWRSFIAMRSLPLRRSTDCPRSTPYRYFVGEGGLISYGPDTIGQYRRAADYIDRVGGHQPTCQYKRQPSTTW